MKAAIITASLSRRAGGLFNIVSSLALSLQNAGVGISVLGLEDEYTSADLPQWRQLEVRAYPALPPRSFGYSLSLLRAVLADNAEIAHCHGIWMFPSVANLIWARSKKKPYVVSTHGMLDSWAVRYRRRKKVIAGLLYENDHLRKSACISASNLEEARAIRECKLSNPICIIPNGVDLPGLPGKAAQQAEKRMLLYLGRIHPKKGLDKLLLAWKQLQCGNRQLVQNWKLTIVGWDQLGYEAQLKRLARELDVSDSVSFLGPRFGQDKADSYRGADAFILPSLSEGLPMAVLEAWAYGLPVIMTPQCNLPEGFECDAAVRIEPHVSSIGSGLATLLSMSDAERGVMGLNGRNLVSERFSWKKIGLEMRSAYEWVLGGGPPPSCVITD